MVDLFFLWLSQVITLIRFGRGGHTTSGHPCGHAPPWMVKSHKAGAYSPLIPVYSSITHSCCRQREPLKCSTRWTLQPERSPAGTRCWSSHHACFMSISFLRVSRQSFQLLAYACVYECVCSPLGNHTTVSVPLLGWLWVHECVIASCYFPSLSVDAARLPTRPPARRTGISLAHWLAGCCALPDSVMKAFRCLETYHFPQLCIPGFDSNETSLYHSQDN